MGDKETQKIQQRQLELTEFLKDVENPQEFLKKGYAIPLFELFNPFHYQITDEFISILINSGGKVKGEEMQEGEFWINNGNNLLKVYPSSRPPQGELDGEKWSGVQELKEKLGLGDERDTPEGKEREKLITCPPPPTPEEIEEMKKAMEEEEKKMKERGEHKDDN